MTLEYTNNRRLSEHAHVSKKKNGQENTLELRARGCQGGDENYELRFDVFTIMLLMKTS